MVARRSTRSRVSAGPRRSEDAAAGELERRGEAGVDLEGGVGVQCHAGVGVGDGRGEMERGFGARG